MSVKLAIEENNHDMLSVTEGDGWARIFDNHLDTDVPYGMAEFYCYVCHCKYC